MTTGDHNQLPHLVARLSDGSMGEDQLDRLNQQLLADPIALEAYLDHMELDAMLEREFGGQVHEVLPGGDPRLTASRRHRRVQDEVASDSPLNEIRRRRHGTSPARRVTVAAIALAVLVAVGFFVNDWFRPASERLAADRPFVVSSSGNVRVGKDHTATTSPVVGQRLESGTAVDTKGGKVLLQYDDGTQLTLSGLSTLELRDATRPGKQLHLQRGVLLAEVVRQPDIQPMVITTPHTQVRVLGTRFELTASDETGTRLDLENGQVELVRNNEKPVLVKPNSIAVIRSAEEPIQIAPRPMVIAAPDRQSQFPGVFSLDFSADGKSLVAVQGNGGVVYWHDDDTLETVRAVDVPRARVVGVSGPMMAVQVNQPPQLVVWDAALRRPVHVVDNLDQLPPAFLMLRDRGDETQDTTPQVRITLVSPRGDWIAAHQRERGVDSLHFFDFRDGLTWVVERKHLMLSFQVSPDGSLVALGQSLGGGRGDPAAVVDLISIETREPLARLPLLKMRDKKMPGIVPSILAFSADGHRLAVTVRDWLQVWDVDRGEQITTVNGAAGTGLRRIALSPQGSWVAGVGAGRAIQLWNVAQPHRQIVLGPAKGCQSMMFSPDGKQVAALFSGGQIRVWNVGQWMEK